MQDMSKLFQLLGYSFKDQELIQTALTHRSASSNNNERLEFLGDAILGYVISAELYKRFAHAQEGQLSRLRASLVKGESLARIAFKLNLGDYLHLGSGELKSGGFRRESILADAFEAIIGAVYLDSDMDTAYRFVLAFYEQRLQQCDPTAVQKDPKTRLQEYLQSLGEPLPEYEVISIQGEAHAQTFKVGCRISRLQEQIIAEGASRRKAEQAAAEKVLDKLEL